RIKYRCDGVAQLLDLKTFSEIQMTLNKNNNIENFTADTSY
ncbi:uncharacterized protein METZ01_LOCUS505133, partial [marine metagenome]